jgi:hypothetical protein
MPNYFQGRNTIDAVGILADNWKLELEQVELCQSIKTHLNIW